MELIDALAEDIYNAYDNPRLYPAPEKGRAVVDRPKADQDGVAQRRRRDPAPVPVRDRDVL